MKLCMRILLAGTAGLLSAQESLVLDGRTQAAEGKFNSEIRGVGSLRLEFRIHNFELNAGADQQVLTACNQFWAILKGTTQLRIVDFNNNGESNVFDLAGRTDVVIRQQQNIEEGWSAVEMWNANGTGYVRRMMGGRRTPANCGDGILLGSNGRGGWYEGQIAWFRWYSQTVPLNFGPPGAGEADRLAYELDGDGEESTGNGRPLQLSGSPKFARSPIYPPLVSAGEDRTALTNESVVLDGGATVATAGGGRVVAWQWKQERGPVPVQLAGADSPRATMTGATELGTYEFSLTVTDEAQQNAVSRVRVGVIPVNRAGVIQIQDPKIAFLLGPLLRDGASPWPWFDETRKRFGSRWAAEYGDAPPGENDVREGTLSVTNGSRAVRGENTSFLREFYTEPIAGSGTVSVTRGSNQVRGQGTDFLKVFLANPTAGTGQVTLNAGSPVVQGEGTAFTRFFSRGMLLVVNAGGEDRCFMVDSVVNDTTLRLSSAYDGPAARNATYQRAQPPNRFLLITEANGKRRAVGPAFPRTNSLLTLAENFNGDNGANLAYTGAARNPLNHIVIHYPIAGGGVGRAVVAVTAVPTDDELTILFPYYPPTRQGVPFGLTPVEDLNIWAEDVNYYDSVLVHYQNYYRTGLDTHLNAARKLADLWWTFLDGGRRPLPEAPPPRGIGLTGLMLRALDGRPEMWPFIKAYTDYAFQMWLWERRTYNGLYYGAREGGYMQLYAAQMAKVYPDAGVRAEYFSKSREVALRYWVNLQYPDGSWRWEDEAWKGRGQQPFHVGIALEGLIATHRLTQERPILDAILKSLDHLISIQQPAPCRSALYAVFNDDGPWGLACPGPDARPDRDQIQDGRALNNTIIHAFGYGYALTGNEAYKRAGDDMFAATFGAGRGPGADEFWGRADTSMKQYGQSFRSSGSYLAYRQHTAAEPAVTDLDMSETWMRQLPRPKQWGSFWPWGGAGLVALAAVAVARWYQIRRPASAALRRGPGGFWPGRFFQISA